jgi:hypothetical protein
MDEKLLPKLTVAAIGLPTLTAAGTGGERVASTSKVTGAAWAADTGIAASAVANNRRSAPMRRASMGFMTEILLVCLPERRYPL